MTENAENTSVDFLGTFQLGRGFRLIALHFGARESAKNKACARKSSSRAGENGKTPTGVNRFWRPIMWSRLVNEVMRRRNLYSEKKRRLLCRGMSFRVRDRVCVGRSCEVGNETRRRFSLFHIRDVNVEIRLIVQVGKVEN